MGTVLPAVGTPRRWLRSVAIRLVAYPAIAYLTTGAFLFLWQDKLIFPAPETFEKTTPAANDLPFEDLRISVNARDYLHAWWIPAALPSSKVILAFHGNGYVLEDMVGGEVATLHEIGANLMLIDYRGYGLSSTRIGPNESTIDEDAETALNYLLRNLNIPIANVFVLGRSIGSGPATHLALNNQRLGGLILESPFSSIDDAANSWYFRIYPIDLMLRTHFDNLSKIGSVRAPLLIVSGTADALTPTWMSKKIFVQAHQPKQLYLVQGAGHNDLLTTGGDAMTQVLRNFVQETR